MSRTTARLLTGATILAALCIVLGACGGGGTSSKGRLAQRGVHCELSSRERDPNVICMGGMTNISSTALGNISVVVAIFDRSNNVLGKTEVAIAGGGLVPNEFGNWSFYFEPNGGSLDAYDHFKVEYKCGGSTIPYEDWGQ